LVVGSWQYSVAVGSYQSVFALMRDLLAVFQFSPAEAGFRLTPQHSILPIFQSSIFPLFQCLGEKKSFMEDFSMKPFGFFEKLFFNKPR
jgi:hypothetical protein